MTSFHSGGPPFGPPPLTGPPSADGSSPDGGAAHRDLLAQAVARQIIPRLIQAHAPQEAVPDLAALTGRPVGLADVQQLVALALLPDDRPAREAVQVLRARGIPVETLYTDLLAMAARRMGQLWEDDALNFSDVTVGVGRLQQILRDLSPGLVKAPDDGQPPRRVLLLPSPGEQHTFGLVMVGEFFRAAGWEVGGGPSATLDAGEAVRREWYDVVGFSLACEVHLPRLAPAIAAVRRASRNPQVGILVGGPLFLEDPALAGEVGADAVAVNGSLAPEIAGRLVETRAAVC